MKAQRKKSVFGIGFAVFVPGQQNVGRPFVAFFSINLDAKMMILWEIVSAKLLG